MLEDVGMLGENAVVIIISYEVGEPDQPDVDAEITLPADDAPDKVTEPPEGTEITTGAVTEAPPDLIGVLLPAELLATTSQTRVDPKLVT